MEQEKKRNPIMESVVDGLQLPRNEFVELAVDGLIDKSKTVAQHSGDTKEPDRNELTVNVYPLKDNSAAITASDGKNQYGPKRITQEEHKTYLSYDSDMMQKYGAALADKYFSKEIQHDMEMAQQQQKTHSIKR